MVDGLSVRPYVSGAVTLLGSNNYLNAGAAGASVRAESRAKISGWSRAPNGARSRSIRAAGPRLRRPAARNTVDPRDGRRRSRPMSAAPTACCDSVRLDGRVGYSRANASGAAQSSDQFDVQAMLRARSRSAASHDRAALEHRALCAIHRLAFDRANPLVSALVGAARCGLDLRRSSWRRR